MFQAAWWNARRRLLAVCALTIAWATQRVGVFDGDVVNRGGWDSFTRFWSGVFDPELSIEFLRLTLDASLVTIAYATLGTVVALFIGVAGAPFLATSLWSAGPSRWMRRLATAAFVVPRGVHEIVWAILLVQVFGFDPWVAVIAIGLPFGAVTAKVFAETIDEADLGPFRLARDAGAGRVAALCYGVVPAIRGELISYSFYRLECAIRSAAVVGIIGVGGLGFQLDLSFESLRYGEIWTIIAALVIISGLADRWSSLVRRSRGPRGLRVRRWSVVAAAVLTAVSWRWVNIAPSSLWSERTRRLFGEAIDAFWPPTLGPEGWAEVARATVDTAAMSIVAVSIAAIGGVMLGAAAARPAGVLDRSGPVRRAARWSLGAMLLLCRAVPAPLWAFVVVLVLFPGPLPGAVALGVYNIGVVGRLIAEVIEERPAAPHDLALATGATRIAAFVTTRLPDALGRVVAILMYRWEVIVRETVVVGVVGAGGLGQLLMDHRAARDFDAVTGTIVAMLVLALVVDQISRSVRRRLRPTTGDAPAAPRPGRRRGAVAFT